MQYKGLNLLIRFMKIIYCGYAAVKLTGTFFIMKQKHFVCEDMTD
jgi:hypothetical protein